MAPARLAVIPQQDVRFIGGAANFPLAKFQPVQTENKRGECANPDDEHAIDEEHIPGRNGPRSPCKRSTNDE